MFNYLKENKVGIGILIASFPLVFGVITFMVDWKAKQRAQNYANYHSTIQGLYDTKEGGKGEYNMYQRAAIFELGFYTSYKEFTCREIPHIRIDLTNIKTQAEIDELEKRLGCNEQ